MQAKTSRVVRALREVLSPGRVNELGREVGQSVRLRVVTPSRLISALIGAFSSGCCESIADILREFNLQQGTATRYKAFYNRLARPGFPEFVRSLMCRALSSLAMRALEPADGSPLRAFSDIVIHDGSSFALKDGLATRFPGRFTKNGKAAVELHASFSGFHDDVFAVTLAPDTQPERPFLPAPEQLQGKLLLADRGYCSADYFHAIHEHGGHFVIRVTKSFDLWVVAQWRGRRRHVLRRPRRLSKVIGKRYAGRPCDFEVKFELDDVTPFRIIVLPGKESHGTRLATNLPVEQFGLHAVGRIYRFRWQIELVFKEWKSYANLRAFDTENKYIAEGLIWASLLVSILKRFLAHSAQHVHAVAISTRRAAMCLSTWLRQVAMAFERQQGDQYLIVRDALAYLANNAPRADNQRDAITGRLASGLQTAWTG